MASPTTEKPKRGRPKKFVDLELVEKLAHIQCTYPEIASALGVSVDTLTRHPDFAATFKRGAEGGRKSLRRLQFESAAKGNATMQIWLGKQYLGQSDQISNNVRRTLLPSEMSNDELKAFLDDIQATRRSRPGAVTAQYRVVNTEQPTPSASLLPSADEPSK